MTQEVAYTTPSGEPLDLVLYKSDYCFFCHRVLGTLAGLGLEISVRDVNSDPDARATLVREGGKSQVPCLFINGSPLYESADISEFLQSQVKLRED